MHCWHCPCSSEPVNDNGANQDEQNVQKRAITPSVMTLKGPTGVAMAKMIDDNETTGKYDFSLVGSPDEIVSAISSGEADIMLCLLIWQLNCMPKMKAICR